jgi:hypothetical protein
MVLEKKEDQADELFSHLTDGPRQTEKAVKHNIVKRMSMALGIDPDQLQSLQRQTMAPI